MYELQKNQRKRPLIEANKKIELKKEDTWKLPSYMTVNRICKSLATSCNDAVGNRKTPYGKIKNKCT